MATATVVQMRRMGVVDQIATAAKRKNLIPLICGILLGGFVPLVSYTVCHQECASNPALWALVIGGLGYSALTVYEWARIAFKNVVKSVGFVLLLEGTILFSHTQWLSIAALCVLMAINAIATACNLIADRKLARKRG